MQEVHVHMHVHVLELNITWNAEVHVLELNNTWYAGSTCTQRESQSLVVYTSVFYCLTILKEALGVRKVGVDGVFCVGVPGEGDFWLVGIAREFFDCAFGVNGVGTVASGSSESSLCFWNEIVDNKYMHMYM